MTDNDHVPEGATGTAVVTSKSVFIEKVKTVGKGAWREITLDTQASYASRAYGWLGNVLIGSPTELGLGDVPDFYWDEEDRDFPKGEKADDSYEQRKQILTEDFRRDLRHGVSKLAVPVGLLLCTAILMLGQAGIGVSNKAESIGSPTSWFSGDKNTEQAVESDDFSQAEIVDLKRILEQASSQGRTTESSLEARERAALKEYKKRPNSGYNTYPIIVKD